MQMMLIISMVIAALYVGAVIFRIRQIPDSISAMVYAYPQLKWQWTLWLWSVAFLFAPCLIEALDASFEFLGFLTVASLVLCGSMPLFDKDNKTMHYVFGITAGILSQVCVALISPWWLALWVLWVMVFVWKTKDYSISDWQWSVFMAECICYASLMGAVLTVVIEMSSDIG